jgi:L-ascorbate metabolism protein UlaG (beta-lactamase superfamily)
MSFIGHGTLMFTFNDIVIHVDPVGRYADYGELPKADLILITHEHGDHLDVGAVKQLNKPDTMIILTETCRDRLPDGIVLKNGESMDFGPIEIEAVPAYNLDPETRFHPKGVGNGYILNLGGKRIYIAGDTENTPEMKALEDIDVAFLPMNRPYTMTPEMAADAARAFKPKILYPYHYGDTDPQELVDLLADQPEIEVRIRNLR